LHFQSLAVCRIGEVVQLKSVESVSTQLQMQFSAALCGHLRLLGILEEQNQS